MQKSVLALLAAGAMPLAACTTTDDGMMESAATGAGVGAAVGAGAGVLIGGLTPIEGALLGAAVGGLAGAVWHDQDRDGRADGYMYNGRYYEGRPAYQQEQAPAYQAPVRSGERG